MSTAGDINGDGHTDLVIGAPYHNSNTGRVFMSYLGNRELVAVVQ